MGSALRTLKDHRQEVLDPQRVRATVIQDLSLLKLQLQQALAELQTP